VRAQRIFGAGLFKAVPETKRESKNGRLEMHFQASSGNQTKKDGDRQDACPTIKSRRS
jgi:hypothetical protein